MEGILELHGALDRSDLLRAVYFGQLRRTWLAALFLVSPFLLAAAAIAVENLLPESSAYRVTVSQGALRSTVPFVFIFVVWCLVSALMPLRRVTRMSAKLNFSEPCTMVFTAASVRHSSPSSSAEVRWSVITEVCETRSLFLLFIGDSSILLPKRYFQSAEEMSAWRAITGAGIAPKKIRPPGMVARWC